MRDAVEATFAQRQQELPVIGLPSMADDWAAPFAAMASDLDLGTTTAAGAHTLVEDFWRRAQSDNRSTPGDISPHPTN